MKKKLLSVLLTFVMILTLGTSSFSAETNNKASKGESIEDILNDILLNEDSEVETRTSKISLDTPDQNKVDVDLSMVMYDFTLTSDKSINLSYESDSKIFEVLVVGDTLDEDGIIWTETMLNSTGKVSNNVPLKLKKGKYTILVTSTKGSYIISPNTANTLKSMSPFTVNKVLPGVTSMSGKGVAGAKVTVMDESYNTYTTTVKSDNTYKLTIPKQEEGSMLLVKMEKEGYGSKLKMPEVEYAKFSTFIVNQVKSTSTIITGKGKSGATVRAFVDGKKIGETKVKSDGSYSMKIKKQSSGEKILVKIYKSGYETKSKTVTVKKVFTKKLAVNTFKSTNKTISGKGSKGATVRAYIKDKEIGKATVNSKGTYYIKVGKQSKGKVITVKMYKSGFATTSKSITVK